MLWLSYFSFTAGLYMQLWVELLPANLWKPSYKKCVFRGEKTNTFQKTPELAFVGCIYLSLFVIWYSYLDNLSFFRSEWKRRLNKKRMEETERSDGFSRDDTEEFNEAWIHGRVITGMVQKTCIFGFLCKKHNSPMYFMFNLCYVYTTQPYCLYISAVSFT